MSWQKLMEKPEYGADVSIAISLKRIADLLEKMEPFITNPMFYIGPDGKPERVK